MHKKTDNPRGKIAYLDRASEAYFHPYLREIKMDSPDVLGELGNFVEKWTYRNAIFIDSDMGTGKSTLVCEKLVPKVMKEGRGETVLIVSSRVSLNTQYKYDLLRQVESPALKLLSPAGIQQSEEFEGLPVIFCTYQGLPGLVQRYQNGELEKIQYAVFDEIHWLCSDSLFAENTSQLLHMIPRVFRECVRIYMTATPWAVRNLVAQAEAEAKLAMRDRVFRFNSGFLPYSEGVYYYQFPAPKRRYCLHILPAEVRQNLCHKDLIDRIADKGSGKWVVFVDSKRQGKVLANHLDKDADYLDADCKSGALWDALTSKSRFPHRVLVTTAVAEVGLNILDPEVRSIVIMSTDRSQFMQELGRRRFFGNEMIDIYVPNLSSQDLAWRKGLNKQLLQELQNFLALPEKEQNRMRSRVWYSDLPELRRLLPIDSKGNLCVNPCAEQVVRQRELQYQELERFRLEKDVNFPFLYMVRQWLGAYEVEIVYHDNGRKLKSDLMAFLESQVDAALEGKENQAAFSNHFRELREAAFGVRKTGNRRREPWGAQIIQRELEDLNLPYRLEQGKELWVIRRVPGRESGKGDFDGKQ